MNYVIYGEENYRIKKTIQSIIIQYGDLEDDLLTTYYDARNTSLDMILEDANTIPFFNDHKIIVVEHANFLSGSNDTHIDIKALEAYLDHECESTILIFCGYFAKLDSRKAIVKRLKQSWKFFECNRLDEKGKNAFVEEQLQLRKIKINNKAKSNLLKLLPLDMMNIQNELDKLEIYGEMIDEVVVDALISKPLSDDVFALVNAVVNKDVKQAFTLWQDFCILNIEVIYLISLLASQFRFLYQVKRLTLKQKGKDSIAKALQAHPYRTQLAIQTCYRLSSDEILNQLAKLATLDQKLKAGTLDKKLGFELYLLKIGG